MNIYKKSGECRFVPREGRIYFREEWFISCKKGNFKNQKINESLLATKLEATTCQINFHQKATPA
jgi:hypothetical protein